MRAPRWRGRWEPAMPSIDELLDTEATRWRAQTDASFAAATFTLAPPARPATRHRVAWAASALGAAAAATAILLATLNGSSGNSGPALANSGPVRPEHSTSGTSTSVRPGPAPSASCAAPVLSFRDALRHRHFRPVPTRARPVHRGDAVLIYGVLLRHHVQRHRPGHAGAAGPLGPAHPAHVRRPSPRGPRRPPAWESGQVRRARSHPRTRCAGPGGDHLRAPLRRDSPHGG